MNDFRMNDLDMSDLETNALEATNLDSMINLEAKFNAPEANDLDMSELGKRLPPRSAEYAWVKSLSLTAKNALSRGQRK